VEKKSRGARILEHGGVGGKKGRGWRYERRRKKSGKNERGDI